MTPARSARKALLGTGSFRAAPCLIALAAGAAGCDAGASPAPGKQPELTLTEAFSHVVPNTFPITGIATSPDGLLALWSRERSYLLVGAGGKYREVGAGALRRPIGAAVTSGDTLEVADAERQEIVTFAGDRLLRARPYRLPLPPRAAVRAGGNWFFSAVDSSLTTNVLMLEPGGSVRNVYRAFRPGAASARPGASLSPMRDGILVTQVAPPFEALRLGPDGRAVRISRPDTVELNPFHDDQLLLRPLWVGLATHDLDGRYLRTFADARADKRVLFLYGQDGRLLRKSSIDAPLVFAATVPGRQLLIGVRHVGRQEVVGYRWGWGGEQRSLTEEEQ
jgi:hypothetical protein